MKKIPKLYTKNSKGRYQEYKIPDIDISNTFYRKINGNVLTEKDGFADISTKRMVIHTSLKIDRKKVC